MTERLADVRAHISTIEQLGSVVRAMRGIAASRAQQARALLPAVRAYAAIASGGIAQALRLDPLDGESQSVIRSAQPLLILFGPEQGFAGAFADHVLDAATQELASADRIIVGSRAGTVTRDRGVDMLHCFPMPMRPAGIAEVAARVAEAIYDRIRSAGAGRVTMLYPKWTSERGAVIVHRTLLPLDPFSFKAASPATLPPVVQLPPETLLERLGEEYVLALLCEAAAECFAAENEARVSAMASATAHITETLDGLRLRERLTRQEEITAEVVELAAGARARDA